MAESTFDWLRVAAFAIILLPALIENLRRDTITNLQSALVFVAGMTLLAAERLFVATPMSLPWVFWIAAFLLVLLLALFGQVAGGGAKFMIALLPWFTIWEGYAAVVWAGLLLTAALGYVKGGLAPLVPGLYVAGLGALVLAAV